MYIRRLVLYLTLVAETKRYRYILGTAELSPKGMCREDGRPQELGLVFIEYNQSRLQSSE